MKCPRCGCHESEIKDSRLDPMGNRRRKRTCEKCGYTFTTYEVPEDDLWDKIKVDVYQKEAMRTASGMRGGNTSYGLLMNGAMGLAGECGECVDIVKKYAFQGHELDKHHLALELGDVAWYLAVMAQAIGYKLSDVLMMNVEKLRKRYPNGFDPNRSTHREKRDM